MTHYDYDVFELAPSFSDTPRMMIQSSPQAGLVGDKAPGVLTWPQKRPLHSFNFNFVLDGVDAIHSLLTFFNERAGACMPFWLPSWHSELRLAVPISDPGQIDIVAIDYQASFLNAGENLNQESGRNLFFYDHRGNLVVRRVTDVSVLSDTVERLVLDSPLPDEIMKVGKPGQCMIGLLYFCRFAEDSLSMKFIAEDYAQVNIGFMELYKSYTEPEVVYVPPAVTPPTIMDSCGVSVWPSSTNRFPYSNPGSNTDGWGEGIVQTPNYTSNGTEIVCESNINGWQGTDIVVPSQFKLDLDLYFEEGWDPDFIITFADADRMRGFIFRTCPAGSDTPTNLIAYNCDLTNSYQYYFPNPIVETSANIPAGEWVHIQLKKVGTVFTWTCNGIETAYDCQSQVKGRIGFGAYGGGQKKIKNITITTP